ncbi:MAG: amidohydrolase [Deltaproteobacteria bacterium]|nr:amidohydrolase [Deltaproteobacteria bacterium]
MKIIDIECDIPTREVYEAELQSLDESGAEGTANYINIFGPKWAAEAGMSPEEFEDAQKSLTPLEVRRRITERSMEKNAMTEDTFIKMLDETGVIYACIGTGRHASIEHTAALAARHKERLIPWARISPKSGMPGVRALEHAVKELGIRGFEVSTFREQLYPNDKKYYPLYAKCVELGLPVRIYCTMNYAPDRAMDFGRPIYLDEVARDFPELTIIAALGGWPWVPELVGLARRHQNIYIDLAAHRPKHVAIPGSGFEMLLQYGNTLLQDRMVFASAWITLGLPLDQIIRETLALPLKESVKPKWMYDNAAKILKVG